MLNGDITLFDAARAFFFIEVLGYASPDAEVDLRLFQQALHLIEVRQARGSSLRREEDGSVSCDQVVPPQSPTSEYAAFQALICPLVQGDRQASGLWVVERRLGASPSKNIYGRIRLLPPHAWGTRRAVGIWSRNRVQTRTCGTSTPSG